jgi:predicted Zn-dependent protease
MATPSYRPVTPRKLDTIFSASIAGVVVGALLTAVSAAIMYKRDLTP